MTCFLRSTDDDADADDDDADAVVDVAATAAAAVAAAAGFFNTLLGGFSISKRLGTSVQTTSFSNLARAKPERPGSRMPSSTSPVSVILQNLDGISSSLVHVT